MSRFFKRKFFKVNFINLFLNFFRKKEEDEEEEDPLDAFMADIDEQAKKECGDSKQKEKKVIEEEDFTTGGQTGRDDIDQEDMQEGCIKYV